MSARLDSETRNRERGMALLVVLWGITAAALLVSAFNVVARSGAAFISSEIALTEAEALADAGLEIAAAHLIDDDKARRWRADGKPHRLVLGDAELTIAIDDPNGLVDVNKAGRSVLLGLLSRATGKPEDAEALLEGILRMRGEGAVDARATGAVPEATADAAQSPPADPVTPAEPGATNPAAAGSATPESATPKSATSKSATPRLRIADVTELRRMTGMSLALYRKIARHLTVYSRDGRINPFHAPRAVLAALPGLSEADIERFLDSKARETSDEPPIPASLGKAGALLAGGAGPAYTVSVVVRRAGRAFVLGRQFVIATGIDAGAPYRLLATRPLPEGGLILQDRAPQS